MKRRIEESIPNSRAEVRDTTGGGDHFEVVVHSPAFKNRSLLDQHRLVYQALGEAMDGPIHAVQIRTFASDG